MIPSAPWTRALEERRVRIPGATYECAPGASDAPHRFDAFTTGAYDLGEDGVRRFVLRRFQGVPPAALPVFFGREHMQRNIFVRDDSPLIHPRDLIGKRIGSHLSPHSGTGAGVLMMLEQGYGIPLKEIKWSMGNPATLPANRMGLDLSLGPRTDRENFELLFKGALDAVIVNLEARYWSLFGPDTLGHGSSQPPNTRPLITDPAVIADAYRRTGLYPITDVVVMQPELIREHSDLPSRLVHAFSEANALASDYRNQDEEELARREVELLGEDPHRYGLGENARKNLGSFIDILYRLGAIERTIAPDDLFVPQT
jgi:hypothetical protein